MRTHRRALAQAVMQHVRNLEPQDLSAQDGVPESSVKGTPANADASNDTGSEANKACVAASEQSETDMASTSKGPNQAGNQVDKEEASSLAPTEDGAL